MRPSQRNISGVALAFALMLTACGGDEGGPDGAGGAAGDASTGDAHVDPGTAGSSEGGGVWEGGPRPEAGPITWPTEEWPMLAANPERTSWTSQEVRGPLSIEWYHPIEPFIPTDEELFGDIMRDGR